MLAHAALAASRPPSAFAPPEAAQAPEETLPLPPVPAKETEAKEIATLRRRLSGLLLVTLEGSHLPTSNDAAVLAQYPPAGVIIDQLPEPATAKQYVERLRQLGSGLLIGAEPSMLALGHPDTPNRFMPLPSLLSLAATRDSMAAASLGAIWGESLHTLGVNLCMGPSLGLAPQATDAEGSIHCLGSDPVFAADAAEALCGAIEGQTILAIPLGFPGGAWNHLKNAPAVLSTPVSTLAQLDLLPYTRVIEAGARAVHVGPILVPTLDPEQRPACLSRPVLQDLLRGTLKFEGVAIAGPLDSPALRNQFPADEAGCLALSGGADLLYVSNAAAGMRIVDRLVTAIRKKEIDLQRVEEAERRIAALRKSLLSEDSPTKLSASKMAHLEDRADFRAAAFKIERQSITCVLNRNQTLPLQKKLSEPLGVTGVTGVFELQGALNKFFSHVARQDIQTAKAVHDIAEFEIRRVISGIGGRGTLICVLDDQVHAASAGRLIRAIQARGLRVVAVYLGYPKHLDELAMADALVLAYGGQRTAAELWKAVAETLIGRGTGGIRSFPEGVRLKAGEARSFNAREIVQTPGGMLPVTVSPQFPAGQGVSYATDDATVAADWDFGDGTHKNGLEISHTYSQPGSFILSIEIKDRTGAKHRGTVPVTVE